MLNNGMTRVRGAQLIALLGESLLIDTIESSLTCRQEVEDNRRPDLRITRLSSDINDEQQGRAVMPDLIVADLSSLSHNLIFDYMAYYPYVSFLGIDPASHRVLWLTCEQFNVRSVDDLTAVINIITETKVEPTLP